MSPQTTDRKSTARRLAARLALFAAASVVLAGCSASSTTTEDMTTGSNPAMTDGATHDGAMAATTAPGDATPSAALNFTATTLDGQPFDGTSLIGHPTVIWFWASWCPLCNGEGAEVSDALHSLPDGVQAIGVPGDSDVQGMKDFVAKYGLGDIVQVVDTDGSIWRRFFVPEQPALAIVDATGHVQTVLGTSSKQAILTYASSIAP